MKWPGATKTGFLVLLSFYLCFYLKGKVEVAVLAGCCLQVSSMQVVWLVQLVEANTVFAK